MRVPGIIPCLGTGNDFGKDCNAVCTLISIMKVHGGHTCCAAVAISNDKPISPKE